MRFPIISPFLLRLWPYGSVSIAVRHLIALLLMVGFILPVSAQDPGLLLTKSIDGGITTAEVGDVLRYRVRFECSSLSISCGQLEILDALPPGLIYLPPPDSSIPTGFSIAYDAFSRTITLTKDDNNFLDGTQFDAVLAVQVDYDLRPLTTTITNTLTGRINPPGPTDWIDATPVSAPPVTIDGVTVDWDLTKTLIRPVVNPTVGTNVTYELALCPGTISGNVPLTQILLTDTLPLNAIFVEASDGGTEAGGIVSWPPIPGPIIPPDCVTRTVTVQYPDAAFNPGDSVTNTANAGGSFVDSGGAGNVAPNLANASLTHDLDLGRDEPTYSKDDAGDPVGMTGTGRFFLTLSTEDNNVPSADLMLVDHMPPQLRITEVTSGQWDVAFSAVQAFVEYSTNNASTWTLFPGTNPASYNSNITYTAPVQNITDVRWRFVYEDPIGTFNNGLPFGFIFTQLPEIRITPRSTPTVADPPSGAALPAAVSGTTYNNCMEIQRTNLSGNPVVSTCDLEPLTVEGGLVSIRVYKDETAGENWDEAGDPDIDVFVPDSNLLPNDTLRYVLTLELTERSSVPLVNPTLRDTLPAGLVFVRSGISQLDGSAVAQPIFTQNGADLTWEWTSLSIPPRVLGSRLLTVEFFARVPAGQTAASYTNAIVGVTDSVDVVCEIGSGITDGGDIDQDGDTTEPGCLNTDIYVVERSAALRGEKWIRSTDPLNARILDATTFAPSAACPNGGIVGLPGGGGNIFTRFPCIATAYPQGANAPGLPLNSPTVDDFEYNIRIFNDGNVDMIEYVLYDILPYSSDVGSGGSLAGSPRLSEFQPTLRGPVEFISGPAGFDASDFTIEYNGTINPCRPEVFNGAPGDAQPSACNNTWSATWSPVARSFRIRMITPNALPQSVTNPPLRFGLPMYIPSDSPPLGPDPNDAVPREISWNSFAHVGSYLDPVGNQRLLLASEPRKVGIAIPALAIDTTDDDTGEGGDSTGGLLEQSLTFTKSAEPPFVQPGDEVIWRIVITNPNAQPATNITVTDDVPSALEVLSAHAPSGTIAINGQQVTLTLAQIDAQASVTLTILTRVRPGADLLEIRNVAILSGSQTVVAFQPIAQTAQSTVLLVNQLPSTGESPRWRAQMLEAIALGLLIGATRLLVSLSTLRNKGQRSR